MAHTTEDTTEDTARRLFDQAKGHRATIVPDLVTKALVEIKAEAARGGDRLTLACLRDQPHAVVNDVSAVLEDKYGFECDFDGWVAWEDFEAVEKIED